MKDIVYDPENAEKTHEELLSAIQKTMTKNYSDIEWIVNTNIDSSKIPTRSKWSFKSTENMLDSENTKHYLKRTINNRLGSLVYEDENQILVVGRDLEWIFEKKELPEEKITHKEETILKSTDPNVPNVKAKIPVHTKQYQIDLKSHRPHRHRPEEKNWKPIKGIRMKYKPIEVEE